jgi:hypothetical protein
MSTRGSPVRRSPMRALSSAVTTFTTPAGISDCSETTLAIAAAEKGVAGAALSTATFPVASAGVSFQMFTWKGAFQGVIRPATP